MIAADLPVDTMVLSTDGYQEQHATVSGVPPLNTLGLEQPQWLQENSPDPDWENAWVELDARNNAISTVHRVTPGRVSGFAERTSAGVTANSMIVRAQTVTGLSLKDLAAVYGVSRQTLYNYKKETDHPSEVNWRRLQRIDEQVSRLARILPASPGALAKRFANPEGDTLLSLLQKDTPGIQQLEALARQLAEQIGSTAPAAQHQTTLDELTRHC